MSIITYSTTPTHRYFERKRKDDLIAWIEQQRGVKLTVEEFAAQRKRTRWALARDAMDIVRSWPE